jgi:hypothetical protein
LADSRAYLALSNRRRRYVVLTLVAALQTLDEEHRAGVLAFDLDALGAGTMWLPGGWIPAEVADAQLAARAARAMTLAVILLLALAARAAGRSATPQCPDDRPAPLGPLLTGACWTHAPPALLDCTAGRTSRV